MTEPNHPGAGGFGGAFAPPGYANPAAGGVPPSMGPGLSWSPSEAIEYSWNLIKSNYGANALPLALAELASNFVSGLSSGLQAVLKNHVSIFVLAPLQLGTSITSLVVQAFIYAGTANFTLQLLRGKRPAASEVLNVGQSFLPVLGALFLSVAAVIAGLLLCVAPGILLAISFVFFRFAIVDQQLGAVDGLKVSYQLARNQWGNLLLLALLGVLISFLGVLACCLGFSFVSVPLMHLAFAYVYLKSRGEEPVAHLTAS